MQRPTAATTPDDPIHTGANRTIDYPASSPGWRWPWEFDQQTFRARSKLMMFRIAGKTSFRTCRVIKVKQHHDDGHWCSPERRWATMTRLLGPSFLRVPMTLRRGGAASINAMGISARRD